MSYRVEVAAVERVPPLFRDIDPAVVHELVAELPVRHFGPGDYLCREGEPGSSMFLIDRGLAEVRVGDGVSVGRLRRGDVIGEMSLLTGERRTASVVAVVPTDALELDQATYAATLSRHPELLTNLSRILSRRLAQTTQATSRTTGRGEAIALVVGAGLDRLADDVLAVADLTSPGSTMALELRGGELATTDRLEGVLGGLDDLLAAHATVLVVVPAAFPDLGLLGLQVDRTQVLANADDAGAIVARLGESASPSVELALVGDAGVLLVDGVPVVRTLPSASSRRDAAWLGRHLSRTKLGLALGAGGAKGYAHVGAVRVLEEAGYEVDYVAGSSIGAIVGVCLGLGMTSHDIEQSMRNIFTPDNVTAMFTLSFAGTSSGADTMRTMLHSLTGDRNFDDDDLGIPVAVMTVDLVTRRPELIDDGPLLDALMAATSLAGFVPPFRRGDQRLIDALALVPVPSDAVRAAGADVTVSVNIMSHRTMPAWPGQAPPDVGQKRERMLDVLLEVMDLGQVDASVRHAARADVAITPSFGPATWRNFELADLFLAAGREAALEQLPALGALARPSTPPA